MFAARTMVCLRRIVARLSADYREYLFGKVGIELPQEHNWNRDFVGQQIDALNAADDRRIVGLAEDLIRNRQYYRSSVAPRYDFDVPFEEFERFLRLEGWEQTQEGRLRKSEAEIVDAQVEEDGLLQRLRASGLPSAGLIETHLNRAAEDYGRDNNNSMTNSRQALEQLLSDIANATAHRRGDAAPVPERVRDYLEQTGFLNQEEKRGFSGAYGFLSGGPHPGIVDQEAARLGRNFALGSCQYALEKYERWVANGFMGV